MAVEKFSLVVFDFLPVFVQQTFEPLDFFFPALFFVLFAFDVDGKPDDYRTRNPDQQVGGVNTRKGI